MSDIILEPPKEKIIIDNSETIRAFSALTDATVALANLMRTQSLLGSSQADELSKALQEALTEITKELKQ